MLYGIAEIFLTLQGEGTYTGKKAVFVRLSGCSVEKCHIRKICDTDYSEKSRLDEGQILTEVRRLSTNGTVVITGGEPTDYNLVPLVTMLHGYGFGVHLETSGVRHVPALPLTHVTVSPKSRKYIQRTGDAIKVVVLPGWTWGDVDSLVGWAKFRRYYLQPLTSVAGKPINTKQVIDLIMSDSNIRGKWMLSTQAHRVWGLR